MVKVKNSGIKEREPTSGSDATPKVNASQGHSAENEPHDVLGKEALEGVDALLAELHGEALPSAPKGGTSEEPRSAVREAGDGKVAESLRKRGDSVGEHQIESSEQDPEVPSDTGPWNEMVSDLTDAMEEETTE